MFKILGAPRRACDGIGRRELLQAGGAGLFGLSLPKLLAAEAHGGAPARAGGPSRGEFAGATLAKAKSVIFLLLFGGPSQLETFDMKPEAPEQIRGPFKPIASRTPDLRICEHLPRTAAVSDKFCVVRTMTHSFNDHSGGGHYVQTGRRWHVPIGGGFTPTPKDWPSLGAITEYVDQQRHGLSRDMPSYMVLPNSLGRIEQAGQYPRPGEHAGWLGHRYNPLTTKIDKKSLTDNPYWRDCSDDELTFNSILAGEGVTLDRQRARQSLLDQFDAECRALERSGKTSDYSAFQQRALALVTSNKARHALDIRREHPLVRDRYGRHLFGQATLMARRLVEAGVRFVTVHYECIDGYSWDSHLHSNDVRTHLLPTFDQAYGALIADLAERGLLDETLVIATGEMGRTPRANANWGRDHWSTLFPAVIAGGGVQGGRLYGKSDKDAAFPIEKPVSPEDLAATVYHALGIDPELRVQNAENRPTQIVEGGEPVLALWGA